MRFGVLPDRTAEISVSSELAQLVASPLVRNVADLIFPLIRILACHLPDSRLVIVAIVRSIGVGFLRSIAKQ